MSRRDAGIVAGFCGQNLDLSSAKRTNHYSLINSRVSSETLSTATQPDLKSAIANRQVRNKDVQYPQQLLWLLHMAVRHWRLANANR